MTASQIAPSADTTAAWLRQFVSAPDPWVRLICFPHAGGAAGFFRPLRDHLPYCVELYGVQYPGRIDRISEACVEDMTLMTAAVTSAVKPLAGRPIALFGHSLGAVIAFEVARRLCARRPAAVGRLFVSGRSAPGSRRPADMHQASDDVLWSELARLGGTKSQISDDPEIKRVFLPALRSDYRLDENYEPSPGPPLSCPVTALLGECDSEVSVAEAQPWGDFTSAGFSLRTFQGGHFYLTEQLPGVIAEIMERLADSVPPRPPGWAGP